MATSVASSWAKRQQAFVQRLSPSVLERGTVVVVPSLTFPVGELSKLAAVNYYEERMLFIVLFLRNPELRVVYVTAMPVDPAIVEYHLGFLPDPEEAARRLRLLHLDDDSVRPLTHKLLGRPEVLDRMGELIEDPEDAYLFPFNVTGAEQTLAEKLDLPLYGPPADLEWLGTKSGSKQVAAAAGVGRLEGRENLFSVDDVSAAIHDLRDRRPGAEAMVIKLNRGTSGQGNVILEVDGLAEPLPASDAYFCADDETWPSYEAKMADDGVIVEEVIRRKGTESPSVQLRIASSDDVEVVSTHDQILGGAKSHQYLGCRFPARAEYRSLIQEEALKIARVLADRGVIGWFGIDFLVVPADDGHQEVYLSEINLRMGGTTHPFWMARLVTGGTYDADSGELVAGGRAKTYVASDNIKSEQLLGRSPRQVIDAVNEAGLGYDATTRTGTTLHLLGALPGHGKMGATCIADNLDDADRLYRELTAHLA